MPQFEWDPALETGNAAIDDQHRMLFSLANDLADAIASCTLTDAGVCEEDEDTLANAIYGLSDYCVEHFDDEEALMLSSGYPRLPIHRSLHEQLSAETLKRAADYFNDEGVIPESLAPFFTQWLTEHIQKEDMLFASYLRERQDV